MADIAFHRQQIYIICNSHKNDNEIVDTIKEGSLSNCQFLETTHDLKSVQDSLEIKRKISESIVVIAVMNQKLMSDDQLQYELALAVDFNRVVVVVRDGTSLPDIFEGTSIIDINKDDGGNWIKNLEAAIEDEIIKQTRTGWSYFIIIYY